MKNLEIVELNLIELSEINGGTVFSLKSLWDKIEKIASTLEIANFAHDVSTGFNSVKCQN